MSSGEINATTMMNRRREVTASTPSSIPGIFVWMAVHVHANKVKPQLKRMFHKVLVLWDGQLLTSSVWIQVSLRLGSEARTNGMQKRTAQSRRVMEKLRAERLSIGLSFEGVVACIHSCTIDKPDSSADAYIRLKATSRPPQSPKGRGNCLNGVIIFCASMEHFSCAGRTRSIVRA